MRYSYEQRLRIVSIFTNRKLEFTPKKYEILSEFAKEEEISISARRARDIIEKWIETGSVADRKNENRGVQQTKISEEDLLRIDRAIYLKRDITSFNLKAKFRIEPSARTIRRYIRLLGWRKVIRIIFYVRV